MLGLRKTLYFTLLMNMLACGSQHENSRLNTIYGSLDLEFMTENLPGFGVVWLARGRNLLFPLCGASVVGETYAIMPKHCLESLGGEYQLWFDRSYLAIADQLDQQLEFAEGQVEFKGRLQIIPVLDKMLPVYPKETSSSWDGVYLAFEHSQELDNIPPVSEDEEGQAYLYSYSKALPLLRTGPCHFKREFPFILHDCDSLPGASGAILINKQTGERLGMHIQGAGRNDPLFYENHRRFESQDDFISTNCNRKALDQQESCRASLADKFYNRAIDFRLIGKGPKL